MKFDDIRREYSHHNEALDALRTACGREWVYRKHRDGEVDRDGNVLRPFDEGLVVQVSVYGTGIGFRVGLDVSGYGFQQRNLGSLSIDDLRLVLEARRVVDLWTSGEISDLPVEPPRPSSAG